MNKFKARLQAIMSKIPADDSSQAATADTISVPETQAAAETPADSAETFSCIVETDDAITRQRDLPADVKAVVIEVAENAVDSIKLLTITNTAGAEIRKFVPFDTKRLTIDGKKIVTENLDGKKFTYDLSTDTTRITFERIDALDCLSPSIQKLKIVVDTVGKQEKFSLPPNTRKITIRKVLPDFLKYTLKVFETADYEKVDAEDSGTEKTVTAPANFTDAEVHSATLAQINDWHNYGGVGYFQKFLMQYGLDWFKPHARCLFTKYRIGFAEGDTGGSGRGIFPLDDTHYYEIEFKSGKPVNAELAKKTLLAFKHANKTPARGMEKIEESFEY